jgi:hypothetical protein
MEDQDRLESIWILTGRLESIAFSKRLREVQEYHRLQRNQKFKDETEQIHRYAILENSRAFAQYKYQYYLGTKIDLYI